MDQILDTVQVEKAQLKYAGFGDRLVALIIDSILLWIVNAIISAAFIGIAMVTSQALTTESVGSLVLMYIVIVGINYLYFALMESSERMATIGKRAMGLKVCDMNGERISFGRATGRYFAKIISGIILGIGYLMVIWSDKKQGLHDQIAGTLVTKK
ncbi:MAG TPA: RDD family protein [Bacteroidia bacterium]|nr:RDD family protein [Bacteroidia bacterium]